MYIRHEVADYPAWRKAYNAFDATRRKLGVTGQAVYQSVDNANDVTVTHDFKTADKAKAFASSPDLKTTMEKAGVKSTPQVGFTAAAAAKWPAAAPSTATTSALDQKVDLEGMSALGAGRLLPHMARL